VTGGRFCIRQVGLTFPLLIKFIDANDSIVIQVHPDDQLAKKSHHAFGKTECGILLKLRKNGRLLVAFNQSLTGNYTKSIWPGNPAANPE